MAEQNPGRIEQESQQFRYNMAAIEERFIGSTPPDLSGRDVPDMLDEAVETQNEALFEVLLKPTFLKRNQRTIEQVRHARREKGYQEGALVFLGHVGIFIDDDRLKARMYFSDVDPRTGLVIPSWRVAIVTQQQEEIPFNSQAEYFNMVQLRGSYGRHYTFGQTEQGPFRLTLNRPQQRNRP